MTSKEGMRALLLEVYSKHGPRNTSGDVVPADKFAELTPESVDTQWDFNDRQLMLRIAKAVTPGYRLDGSADWQS